MSVNIIMQVLTSTGYEPMYPFNPAQCLNATTVDTSTGSQYNLLITGVVTPINSAIGNSLGIISFLPNVINNTGAKISINGDTALPILMADGTAITAAIFSTTQPVFLKYYNGNFVLLLNKNMVGLSNVDNTSDMNKPISNAMQTALNSKLSIPATISNNSNLNTYTTPGMYYCATNAIAATLTNTPTVYSFSLFVEQNAGTSQTVTEYNGNTTTYGNRIWKRGFYNGTWSAWVQQAMIYSGTTAPVDTLGVNGNIYIKYDA